jgi:hypothetical protein
MPARGFTWRICMNARLFAAYILTGACTLAAAQGTIYESKDKAGPVFSDQPSYTDKPTAAKPVVVQPMNVYQGSPANPQRAQSTAPAPYTGLVISAPAKGGTIHSNTGEFSVTLKATPALRAGAGDRLRLKLDGKLLAARYQKSPARVTSAAWQSAAAENVEHTLQAAIVDKTDNVLIESAPVSFYAHRATVRRQAR